MGHGCGGAVVELRGIDEGLEECGLQELDVRVVEGVPWVVGEGSEEI